MSGLNDSQNSSLRLASGLYKKGSLPSTIYFHTSFLKRSVVSTTTVIQIRRSSVNPRTFVPGLSPLCPFVIRPLPEGQPRILRPSKSGSSKTNEEDLKKKSETKSDPLHPPEPTTADNYKIPDLEKIDHPSNTAARLGLYKTNWQTITTDPWIHGFVR